MYHKLTNASHQLGSALPEFDNHVHMNVLHRQNVFSSVNNFPAAERDLHADGLRVCSVLLLSFQSRDVLAVLHWPRIAALALWDELLAGRASRDIKL